MKYFSRNESFNVLFLLEGLYFQFVVVIYIVSGDLGSEISRKEYWGGSLVGKQTAPGTSLHPMVLSLFGGEDESDED